MNYISKTDSSWKEFQFEIKNQKLIRDEAWEL